MEAVRSLILKWAANSRLKIMGKPFSWVRMNTGPRRKDSKDTKENKGTGPLSEGFKTPNGTRVQGLHRKDLKGTKGKGAC